MKTSSWIKVKININLGGLFYDIIRVSKRISQAELA